MRATKALTTLLVWGVVAWIWGNTSTIVYDNMGTLSAVQATQIYSEGIFAVLCLIALLLATMFGLSGGRE